MYLRGILIVADDLYAVQSLPLIIEQQGIKNTFFQLLFNTEITSEYRLFSVSRLIQMFSIIIFHKLEYLEIFYGLLIMAGLIGSAFSIFKITKIYSPGTNLANVITLTYLLSPFIHTYAFWHWSYFILPFQLSIFLTHLILKFNGRKNLIFFLVLLFSPIIALTGESHIIFFLILLFIAGKKIKNLKIFYFGGIAVLTSVLLHYIVWLKYSGGILSGSDRYTFNFLSINEYLYRTGVFIKFYLAGFIDQIIPTINSGIFFIMMSLVIIIITQKNKFHNLLTLDFNKGIFTFFVVMLLASTVVIYAKSIFSGWGVESMWRRYGYMSYTILLLLTTYIIFITKNQYLINLVFSLMVSFFITLYLVNIPTVRLEDNAIIKELNNINAKNLIIIKGWERPDMYGSEKMHGGLDGIRTTKFPEIYESSFNSYWWMSEYLINYTGIESIGFNLSKDGKYLIGSGVLRPKKQKIDISKLAVLLNKSIKREYNKEAIILYGSYQDYQDSNFNYANEWLDQNGDIQNLNFTFNSPLIKNSSNDASYKETEMNINKANVRGYLNVTMNRINWEDQTFWYTYKTNQLSEKLSGFWKIGDRDCFIDFVDASTLILINENMSKFNGVLNINDRTIRINNKLLGRINEKNTRIEWNNGTTWVR